MNKVSLYHIVQACGLMAPSRQRPLTDGFGRLKKIAGRSTRYDCLSMQFLSIQEGKNV